MALQLSAFAFLAALFTGGAIISGLTAGTLLLRQRTRHATLFLAALMLVSAAYLGFLTVNIGRFPNADARFYYLPLNYIFAFGPLLYFYIRSELDDAWRLSRRDTIHWVMPAAQALLYFIIGFASVGVKYQFYESVDRVWFMVFEDVWAYASTLGYGLAALRLLRGKDSAESQTEWLHQLIYIVLIVTTAAILFEQLLPWLAHTLASYDLFELGFYAFMTPVMLSILLFWISASGYLRATRPAAPEPPARKETYAIDAAQLDTLATQLQTHMADNAPYRDPELTLRTLAKQLNVSSKQLSYIINESTGQNFNSYINEQRIYAVKSLLEDPSNSHRSILDLAFDVGFSSKSTFNRVFKQQTGSSPSAFRAQK